MNIATTFTPTKLVMPEHFIVPTNKDMFTCPVCGKNSLITDKEIRSPKVSKELQGWEAHCYTCHSTGTIFNQEEETTWSTQLCATKTSDTDVSPINAVRA